MLNGRIIIIVYENLRGFFNQNMQDPLINAAITELNLVLILLNPELTLTLNAFQSLDTVVCLYLRFHKKKT